MCSSCGVRASIVETSPLRASATIAAAIAEELARNIDYRPVEAGGATRAAELIAELL